MHKKAVRLKISKKTLDKRFFWDYNKKDLKVAIII